MKGLYTGLIILLSVLALSLIAILVMAIRYDGNLFEKGNILRNPENIVKEENISIQDLEKLNISMISNDAYIYETDEDEIRIVQYANKELKEKNLFSIDKSGNTVTIKDGESRHHFAFFSFGNYTIYEIYIPKKYHNQIKMTSVSGELSVDYLEASDITMSTTSGDILVSNTLIGKTTIKTVSGEIRINTIEGDSNIKTTSGDVEVSNLIGNSEVKTISGEIELHSVTGKITVNTTSGDVDITSLIMEQASSIKTVSGEIRLGMTSDLYHVKTKSVSGDIKAIDSTSLEEQDTISLQTTSGDITVVKR